MKRFTLFAAMALAMSMTANAQTWEDNLTTVDNADDYVRSTPMAVDASGNTVVTGRYSLQDNLQFGLYTFTGVTANDAFIAKYDAKGAKQWVAGINGNAVFTALDTDAEGNIYAAGIFAAEAQVCGTSGEPQTITDGDATNTSRYSSFIVKYDKDGVVKSVKTLVPVADYSVVTSDEVFPFFEPVTTIAKIQADGDKVYFSLSYRGTVTIDDLTLDGRYVDAIYVISDVNSAAIVSVNASDLGSASTVAFLGAQDKVMSSVSYQSEGVNFTVDNGVVYAGFIGQGTLGLTTAAGTETITLSYGDDGSNEHGFIFAKIDGNSTVVKTYNTTPTSAWNLLNEIDQMVVSDGKLLVAGTFNIKGLFGGLEYKDGCDMFVASLNTSDLSLVAAKASNLEEGDANNNAEVVTALFFYDNAWYLTGYSETTSDDAFVAPLIYTIDPATCQFTDKTVNLYVTAAAENNGTVVCQYGDDGKTYRFVSGLQPITGINEVADNGNTIERKGDEITASAATDFAVYAADGALVKAAKASTGISLAGLGKGVYVVKAGQKTVKVSK